jgi:16S rRNA processing protein RimM
VIVLGRIVAPFGVQGWVKLQPFGDDPETWRSITDCRLGPDAEGPNWQACELKELKAHGKTWVARFAGVDDRSAAERLEGMYIGAPREAMPMTAKDEFYWNDLIGLRVENLQGEALGSVMRMIDAAANAVLVVVEADGREERLLPFVGNVIKEVDLRGGRIRVDWGKDW